jgi:hypothetical protein
MADRTHLAELYQLRKEVQAKIDTLEGVTRRKKRKVAKCGTDSGYYRHRDKHVPFPEDEGNKACGCRKAHAAAEQRRKTNAERRAREEALVGQTTIYDIIGKGA